VAHERARNVKRSQPTCQSIDDANERLDEYRHERRRTAAFNPATAGLEHEFQFRQQYGANQWTVTNSRLVPDPTVEPHVRQRLAEPDHDNGPFGACRRLDDQLEHARTGNFAPNEWPGRQQFILQQLGP
jgi:hypothetical protein